jgi:hypothetical protein
MSACPPAIEKNDSGFGNVNYCGSFFVAAADTEVSDLQIYILDGNLLWTKKDH